MSDTGEQSARETGPRYDLGLLFTDGLPDLDDTAGYRGTVAARAAGISYRQLDYWARTELVEPTIRGAAGSGTQRLYGFRDILVLKLVKRLLDTGISLQQIRTAVNQLREAGVNDLAQTEGQNFLRWKGILAFKNEPRRFVFQGVHMILDGDLQREWTPQETRRSKLVFIGKELDEAKLRQGFEACAA